MSGIVGIVNFDGAPVDRELLERMTASLDFRGPDARQVWVCDNVGFGHTLLRTTFEAEHEAQPLSFDGKTWIVADCRVDAREELVAKLQAKGRRASMQRPDVELILHAWHVWGEDCVHHLLGDFAFAIWDPSERRLFCARDHMGVKPFYYAHIGQTVVFSNTLDCVRMHPKVSDELNDQAIADFLIFGENKSESSTTFDSINRLERAQISVFSNLTQKIRKYWELPVEEPIYFPKSPDYVENLSYLLSKSVFDRLRVDSASIYMSGGIDSTTLALYATNFIPGGTFAFTSLVNPEDSERHFANLAAKRIGLPIVFRNQNAEPLAAAANKSSGAYPEPCDRYLSAEAEWNASAEVSARARVALDGEGPDNALFYEWAPYVAHLTRQRRYMKLMAEISNHVLLHKRVPLLPSICQMIRLKISQQQAQRNFPDWINPSLAHRLDLKVRWKSSNSPNSTLNAHPIRPSGYKSFALPAWATMFEQSDCAWSRSPLEVRFPFMDLRLLQYMLRVPALPWCREKLILRLLIQGQMPEPIVRRAKTPLAIDPLEPRRGEFTQVKFEDGDPICNYIDKTALAGPSALDVRSSHRVNVLHHWTTTSASHASKAA